MAPAGTVGIITSDARVHSEELLVGSASDAASHASGAISHGFVLFGVRSVLRFMRSQVVDAAP